MKPMNILLAAIMATASVASFSQTSQKPTAHRLDPAVQADKVALQADKAKLQIDKAALQADKAKLQADKATAHANRQR